MKVFANAETILSRGILKKILLKWKIKTLDFQKESVTFKFCSSRYKWPLQKWFDRQFWGGKDFLDDVEDDSYNAVRRDTLCTCIAYTIIIMNGN